MSNEDITPGHLARLDQATAHVTETVDQLVAMLVAHLKTGCTEPLCNGPITEVVGQMDENRARWVALVAVRRLAQRQ